MTVALGLACRALLFAIFAVAGIAKLRDRDGTMQAAAAFGVPGRLARPVALTLPVAELATAALLVVPGTAVAGALAALVLLAAFTAAIGVSLARGRRPACRCFGQLSAQPVGARTLARNALLLAAAAGLLTIELADPLPDTVGWLSDAGPAAAWITALAVALLAVAGAAAVALNVLRAYGRVLRRVEELERQLGLAAESDGDGAYIESGVGLPPGSAAPLADVVDLDGRAVSAADGELMVLMFTSPRCGPCGEVLPDVGRWQREYAGRLSFAVAVDGTPADARSEARQFALGTVITDNGSALADAFGARGTPSAVVVDDSGAVASWVEAGPAGIRELVHAVVQPEPVSVGDPTPDIELETLDGSRFALDDLRGREAAIVFWSPTCGFCRQMHEPLRDHAELVDGDGPALVIASDGSREAIRAEGFGATVIVDQDRWLAGSFGAGGTPMAVLIGADGTVASELAAGPGEVLGLLNPVGLAVTQVDRIDHVH